MGVITEGFSLMMNDEFWDSHIIRVRTPGKHGQQINPENILPFLPYVPLSLMSRRSPIANRK